MNTRHFVLNVYWLVDPILIGNFMGRWKFSLFEMNKSHSNSIFLTIIIITLCFAYTQTRSSFKIYPLVDSRYEQIYYLTHNFQGYYLTLNCQQPHIFSLSLTSQISFETAPRFNIYGHRKQLPNITKNLKTSFIQCDASVHLDTLNHLIEVRRVSNKQNIFGIDDLIFKSMSNQFKVKDRSTKWGLGERFQKHFEVTDGKWTIWNRDKPWKIDSGNLGSSDQTYGHQPVYLARQRQSKLFHLVYFRNTYGMLIESKNQSDQLTYNSVGGNIHFIIVIGQQDPQQVITRYHNYIGSSHIPPFWSMGFHQSRWGYRNLGYIQQVIAKFNEHDLPLDAMWSDLQYMDRKMIFTVNQNTHPSKELNHLFEREELHFVPLMDVGVSVNDVQAIKLGIEMNVFFKNPKYPQQLYIGEVWPGSVHFIDYLHPNASKYWKSQLYRLYKKIKFSGIWLDMNQPSNFRGGEGTTEPFRIQQNQNINTMTINVQIKHYTDSKYPLQHRQVHSYYGHLSTVPTFEFLSELSRPFIITRSNSVGTGAFAGHWTGDNVANWEFLRASINGNFLFQIFGMQMVGADICGFYMDTHKELCARWMQLGAFYPFARNHNHQASFGQEPYQFGDMLLGTSRASLKMRYALLKQLYTILLSKKGQGTFFRPVAFQFYSDQQTFQSQIIETQFMIGNSLMVTPIVYQDESTRSVYFPGQQEQWFSFQTSIINGMVTSQTVQRYMGGITELVYNYLPAAPPTFLRSGHMLLTNYPENRSVRLNNAFHVFAALNQDLSLGSILGIQDYNFQPHISQCIEDDCRYNFRLMRVQDSSFQFHWQFSGDVSIRDTVQIQSFFIVFKNREWTAKQHLVIQANQGTFSFEGKQILPI